MTVRSAPAVIGHGAALAVILGAFTYTGGKLSGYTRDPNVDEVGRKEYLRKNRRRPVEGTVHNLGEGRGKSGSNEIFSAAVGLRADKHNRCLRAGLRGEESGEAHGELRHRREESCARGELALATIERVRSVCICT